MRKIEILNLMQTFRKSLPLALALLLLSCGSVAVGAVVPPKVVSAVEPEHPPALFERGLGGFAKVTIQIAADGTVTGAEVAEASDPALGDAAVAAVKQWTFEPATREGEPIAIKVAQRFDFPASIERTLTFLAGRPVFLPEPDEVVSIEELRARPVMINGPARPHYPSRFAGSGQVVGVPLQFIINPEGLPINPEVVMANESEEPPDINFQLAALRAILSARWEPSVQGGKPVYVRDSITLWVHEGDDFVPPGAAQERTRSGSERRRN